MIVAVQNPSNLVMEKIEIAVPHGRFQVQSLIIDGDIVSLNASEATVLCANH
jgi:hypothetical protein